MRRKEREVTSTTEIAAILQAAHVIHLGIQTSDYPYVVPTNYGFEFVEQQLIIYLHGAPAGRKRDLIAQQPKVGFEIDDGGHLMPATNGEPSKNSFAYRSIIGTGEAELVTDLATKQHALQTILVHETGHPWPNIKEHDVEYVGIIKIKVNQYSAKAHYDPK
ncbi:pyridoxamine 5'-phosphate oxidase family protein [Loigolactobacillus binensis]|uniref:Pyridoxamine 5'-phosphate oxidase family protein n=1 Tax=Loigolactobacillus binensis TaxID=2559922 RepID=A0ABW3ECP8_9LACO|nr:pyridoxamine 5'-phosphate oxidase family protein [Loigolactobacillus binensis]